MANEKKTIYLISKTHWDREWYLDFQSSRIRLVHLVDNLLDILDDDPEFSSFMMDGQMIPLEDYLSIKPHNYDRIKRFVQEGRIVIGPWYMLPDEVLISGESHIRNYLMGERVSRKFGTKMNIGYLPDAFGHPSQMPQILNKLGMDCMIFWRGATQEVDKTEFYWQAPDGSKVLVELMPYGYSMGAEIPEDGELLAKRMDRYIKDFSNKITTDVLHMSNGGDHLEPSPFLSKVLKEANENMKEGKVIHTNLPKYFEDLKSKIKDVKDVKTCHGEMMGVSHAILLGSTLSTRMYLKQLNHKAQILLENYLEPIHTFASINGYSYPQEILIEAWRYFMKNLPHDSICGCSIDEVHRDMLYRYRQVHEIGDHLLARVNEFYDGINTSGLKGDYFLTVFNTNSGNRSEIVDASIDISSELMETYEYNNIEDVEGGGLRKRNVNYDINQVIPTGIKMYDGDQEIPCKLKKAEILTKLKLHDRTYPDQISTVRCHVSVHVKDIPSVGYKTFSLIPTYDEDLRDVKHDSLRIENEYFSVTPNQMDGSITVTDKMTDVTFRGINTLVDSGDCGDEYNYCPPEEDEVVTQKGEVSAEITEYSSVRQTIKISGIMMIPETVIDENKCRSSIKVDCPYSSYITVYPGVHRIDVSTKFENNAKFHRLRVLFPAGFKADYSHSAGAFSVDRRPINPPLDPNWMEEIYTKPQKDFCDVSNSDYGLTIANHGLPEFEVYNQDSQSVIAVTLLRCVGELSKVEMRTVKEVGGWNLLTPEGQCLGSHTFEYSIIPHSNTWEKSKSYIEAHNYNVPLKAMQIENDNSNTLPAYTSMIDIKPESLIISAFKRCEFEDGYILRFYNTSSELAQGRIIFGFNVEMAYLTGMDEIEIRAMILEDNSLEISVDPWDVITLKLIQ